VLEYAMAGLLFGRVVLSPETILPDWKAGR
jgi:hypothetical protein